MEAMVRQPRRWTLAEYERLIAQGVFRPDERLELLDGEIVTMTPQNSPHAMTVILVQEALHRVLGPGMHLRIQLPLALEPASEPEPDAAIAAGSPRDYPDAHPKGALLVLEVADSTLKFDRQRKGPLYARSGVPEYWIVNLVDHLLEVYREPTQAADGWTYRLVRRYGPTDNVCPGFAPDAAVNVADLLP